MIGSLFLIEASSLSEVKAFNDSDPFGKAGIWGKVSITGSSPKDRLSFLWILLPEGVKRKSRLVSIFAYGQLHS